MKGKAKDDLLARLEGRFGANQARHQKVAWARVLGAFDAAPALLEAIAAMEATGGEPDLVVLGKGDYRYCDCSAESPAGRRSLCYDDEALAIRKEHKPAGSVLGMAGSMGIEVLGEDEYRSFQALGEFDLKTSSWILTPSGIRSKGGALFCDKRYGQVFTYHNGAESYYSARGFRGMVRLPV